MPLTKLLLQKQPDLFGLGCLSMPFFCKQLLVFEKGTCIKGLFWPPLEPKTKKCFSPISFDWFIRRITEAKNFGIYFKFYRCYGNKNARQNRLKTEKMPFRTKFKAFGDQFFKISYTKISFIYVVCRGNSHLLLKYLFGICLCS